LEAHRADRRGMSNESSNEVCPRCAPRFALLEARNAELQACNAALEARIKELEERLKGLGGKLEEALRASKRQAAPFSKGPSAKKRKKPGRKPGKGPFSYRVSPAPEELSVPPVEVGLPTSCAACGGQIQELGSEMLYRTELPELPKPVVKAYRVHHGRCRGCGKHLRAQHPEIAPEQTGATAHRLGPRALATAHALHYDVGLPVRKVPHVLKLLSGLPLTQGALTQDALRRARGPLGQAYERLREQVRERDVLYTDDTSWKVAGQNAQLMAFDTDQETVYQIRTQHRKEEVREIVPPDYCGTMVSDRAPTYDAKLFEEVDKQKCLAHVLRSVDAVLKLKVDKTRWFGKHLKALLQQCIRLWNRHRKGRVGVEEYRAEGQRLTELLDEHLRERGLSDPDNQRLLDELGWQHRQGSLVRFLKDPAIEPTNNRAERALRPAVIARKVSQGSKTPGGAQATATFKSVIQTLKKRGVEVIEGLVSLFKGGSLEGLHPT